eukprot:952323-Rhodomonas_salina.1
MGVGGVGPARASVARVMLASLAGRPRAGSTSPDSTRISTCSLSRQDSPTTHAKASAKRERGSARERAREQAVSLSAPNLWHLRRAARKATREKERAGTCWSWGRRLSGATVRRRRGHGHTSSAASHPAANRGPDAPATTTCAPPSGRDQPGRPSHTLSPGGSTHAVLHGKNAMQVQRWGRRVHQAGRACTARRSALWSPRPLPRAGSGEKRMSVPGSA